MEDATAINCFQHINKLLEDNKLVDDSSSINLHFKIKRPKISDGEISSKYDSETKDNDEIAFFSNSLLKNIQQETQNFLNRYATTLDQRETEKAIITVDFVPESCHLESDKSMKSCGKSHDILGINKLYSFDVVDNMSQPTEFKPLPINNPSIFSRDSQTAPLRVTHEDEACQADIKHETAKGTQTVVNNMTTYNGDITAYYHRLLYQTDDCSCTTIETNKKVILSIENADQTGELKIILTDENKNLSYYDDIHVNDAPLDTNNEFNKIVNVGNRLLNVINHRSTSRTYRLEIYDVTPKKYVDHQNNQLKEINEEDHKPQYRNNADIDFSSKRTPKIIKSSNKFYRKKYPRDNFSNKFRQSNNVQKSEKNLVKILLKKLNTNYDNHLPPPVPAVYSSLSNFNQDPLHKKSNNYLDYRQSQLESHVTHLLDFDTQM